MYKSKFKSDEIDRLFKGILSLENEEECYRFFEDLCTIAELKSMGQRLEVAKHLCDKETYGEIESKTGASTATISRVNKCLTYGADGYTLILPRIYGPEKEK